MNKVNESFNKLNEGVMNAWKFIAGTIAGGVISWFFFSGKLMTIFSTDNYQNIGDKVGSSSLPFTILFLFGCFGTLQWLYLTIKLFLGRKAIRATFSIIGFFFILYSTYSVMMFSSKISMANDMDRNIEIIHPYISNEEYIKLKSDLLQANSKQAFDKIDNRVRDVAKKSNANIN
ncbi:hypothetical protein ACI1UG_09315 [Lactococcus garvieae]|uniref:hypothetical protein n=1 Tax=Lactococcus garvieae TaxID=1363 RepID=UPI003851F54E